ncbi:hypothetical protein C6558_26485 [Ensifer sp. NM-2]|nr:hypothetical protein C6558_26485 [Ensifer sp. NM-2]
MPDYGAFIWEWFWKLRQSQPPRLSGPVPVSNLEFMAWCQTTGNMVSREELAILKAMDAKLCAEIERETEAIRARETVN